MSMASIQPGTYQRAADALCLEEPYSDTELNDAASRYEEEHGIPLVRPEEEDEDGRPNEKFVKRMAKFKVAEPAGSTADPAIIKKELKMLLTLMKTKGVAKLSIREMAAIHECQKSLGLPLTNFKKAERSPRQIAADAEQAFNETQQASETFNDRIETVQQISDIATLELFATNDTSDDVREAAMRRIEAVKLSEIPPVE